MSSKPTTSTPAPAALRRAGVVFAVVEFDVGSGVESGGASRAGGYGLQAAAALGEDACRVFKTLMVSLADGRLAAGVVPSSGQLDLKALAAALGAKRVTMADPAVAERRTGYVVGGISPVGQKLRSPVVLDSSALDHPDILVSAGRRGLDVRLAASDLVRVTGAVVADIAAR